MAPFSCFSNPSMVSWFPLSLLSLYLCPLFTDYLPPVVPRRINVGASRRLPTSSRAFIAFNDRPQLDFEFLQLGAGGRTPLRRPQPHSQHRHGRRRQSHGHARFRARNQVRSTNKLVPLTYECNCWSNPCHLWWRSSCFYVSLTNISFMIMKQKGPDVAENHNS